MIDGYVLIRPARRTSWQGMLLSKRRRSENRSHHEHALTWLPRISAARPGLPTPTWDIPGPLYIPLDFSEALARRYCISAFTSTHADV